jgi:MSHA pilin protein MshC
MDVVIQKRVAGFTLIELVMVISLIAILATAATFINQSNAIVLDAQAKQLASDIRYTQSLAMTNGQRFYLIKVSSTTYEIRNASDVAQRLPLGSTTMTLNSGITFGTFTNLPNNLIAFSGLGAPYTTSTSPGTALSSTGSMALTKGSYTKTISITPETGKVSVS